MILATANLEKDCKNKVTPAWLGSLVTERWDRN